MSMSVDARRQNVNDALVSFLNSIGEGHFVAAIIQPKDHPVVKEHNVDGIRAQGLFEPDGF